MYREEIQLVSQFRKTISELTTPLKIKHTEIEFVHLSGRTDIVGITDDGEIIAIEAKLTNWKNALQQAYRNTCFAHFSYVLLPSNKLTPAIKSEVEFTKRNVGLLTLVDNEVQIIIESRRNQPFVERITDRALKLFDK